MKALVFDVMLDGWFIHAFKYKYCSLFPIDAKELANNANMPYCWEDVYNRLIGGYRFPFKVEVNSVKQIRI